MHLDVSLATGALSRLHQRSAARLGNIPHNRFRIVSAALVSRLLDHDDAAGLALALHHDVNIRIYLAIAAQSVRIGAALENIAALVPFEACIAKGLAAFPIPQETVAALAGAARHAAGVFVGAIVGSAATNAAAAIAAAAVTTIFSATAAATTTAATSAAVTTAAGAATAAAAMSAAVTTTAGAAAAMSTAVTAAILSAVAMSATISVAAAAMVAAILIAAIRASRHGADLHRKDSEGDKRRDYRQFFVEHL